MNPQRELLYKDITDKILKSAFEVYNDLRYGFLEKVYENALLLALRKNGALAEQQKADYKIEFGGYPWLKKNIP